MHTGCLLILCSYCCLHLNPVWSELSPRSSPNPQSSAAWLQRFPLCRFLFVALRGFSTLSLQNDNECWGWLILPQVLGSSGRRGCPQPRAPREVPPQLRGCSSHIGAVAQRLGAFPSPYQDSWVSTVYSAAGSDLKVAAPETPDLKKKNI